MPFADVCGGVTGPGEALGDSDVGERQVADGFGFPQVGTFEREPVFVPRGVIGQAQSPRRLPRHHRCPRRRANRGRGIGIREAHAIGRH